ncbi:oligosaccharide flippase family protein [Algoriphagus sediminis]|uniref:Oligosaccharide flippase family protein n=1 Tax=Algoriphagus sediminis TaxID=3057113 RepID=A0ABT7YCA1_9BACT|nr:oligosaccharide flippase family protein [Algoriphagus sediminis]MDN3204144.1 oligosaccharide flippase family protein [Algoriphagus sediminis]
MFEKISFLSFSSLIRNRSIQNFLFLAVIQSSNVLISIISMPLLIQSIGVDQFGLVNLALSVIILLNIVVGFGYNLSAPKQVATNQKDKEALSHVVSNVFSSKVLLAALSTLFVFVAVFGLNLFQEYQMILVFSVLLLFSEAILPLWFFQGMEKMKLISIANIFSKLLFLLGIVLFIHSPGHSKWVNFMLGLSGISINIFLLTYIHTYLGIRVYRPEFSAIWQSLKDNILLFFSNLASHISINGGLIILSFFSVAETLGMYSLAERVVMVIRLLPPMVFQAIIPRASALYKEDKQSFFSFLRKIHKSIVFTGCIVSVFTYYLAPWIIELLSRSILNEAVEFLRVLAFVPFFASFNVVNVTILISADQRKLMFKASWLMCVFMIFVSSTLTYFFDGIGLCYGILATELFIFLLCTILLYRFDKSLITDFYGITENSDNIS